MSLALEWKTALNASLSKCLDNSPIDPVFYTLSTIDDVTGESTVRMVQHRGFVGEPSAGDNPATNPPNYMGTTGDSIVISTDVRSTKVRHLLANPHVSICWWHGVTGEQYRITGKAYLSPRPDHELSKVFHDNHGKRLSPGNNPDFDWEDERSRIFGKLIPPIRAAFARPTPGSSMNSEKEMGDFAPIISMSDDMATINKAYENFALLIIEPLKVDRQEAFVRPNKRTLYSKSESGEWNKADLWP